LNELTRWLESRRPAAPPSLQAALRVALNHSDPGDGPVQDRLAMAGLATLRRVAAEPSTRDHALELLAADALITYACEAAVEAAEAEVGGGDRPGDPVETLTRTLNPARFAGLLAGNGGT